MMRRIVFYLLGFAMVACQESRVIADAKNEFSVTELDKNNDVGEVSTLDDVYKLAFEAAQKSITYENASTHLDQLEEKIHKEIEEVLP